MVDAGGERVMLAEVAAELHAANAPVLAPELPDQRPGVVGAAVVDEHDREMRRDRLERGNETAA